MIAVDALSLDRGNFSLSGISFAIPEGTYTVLMGPSGAGKTLLLETIAGIYPVREGTITLAEREVTLLPPESRGVGFVYQDYSLFPHLTVEENVSFGLRMSGIPSRDRKVRVQALLTRFGILPLAGRYPGTLSGGEKQRVALARALAIRPAVLLLDEPFSALDPDTRTSCMEEVKAIQREHGLTILQVSHAREEAYLLADQVVVMDNGMVIQTGSPAEVFSHPVHRTVAMLAGFENVLEGTSGHHEEGKTSIIIDKGSLDAEGRFPLGERYLVCIRAGDILLSATGISPVDSGTRIRSRVVSCTETDRGHRLKIEDPFPLTIDISRHVPQSRDYHPGEWVEARIDPGCVHLVPITGTPGTGGHDA